MIVYCVFERFEMNTYQAQYMLWKIFANYQDAIDFIFEQEDSSKFSLETHTVE